MARERGAPWRLFVALDLDGPARSDLAAALARVTSAPHPTGPPQLPSASETTGPPIVPTTPDPIRWIDPDRWHLTLAFLGDVAPVRVERLTSALSAAAAASSPVRWRMAGVGRFPERGTPRVLWAGVAGEVDGLAVLARRVRHAARTSGIDVERRAYRPHVTLARVRDGGTQEARSAVAAALREFADLRAPVVAAKDVVLYRSHPGPRPVYERLANCPLAGGEPARRRTGGATSRTDVDPTDQSRSTT